MKLLSEEDVMGVQGANINDRAGAAMVASGIIGGFLGAIGGPVGAVIGTVFGSAVGTAIFGMQNPGYLDEAKKDTAR